jgi:F-type H+-transporting ATPase subunit delta
VKSNILAKRYSKAYIETAKVTIGRERAVDEIRAWKRFVADTPGMMEFIKHPGIPCSEKCGLLEKALDGKFSKEFMGFMRLLIHKGRAVLLPNIADEIVKEYLYEEEQVVLLKTTLPLEDDLITEIKTDLERKLCKKVRLFIRLDPNLLGGVQIFVDNFVIDGSVKKYIEDLRKQLKTASVV